MRDVGCGFRKLRMQSRMSVGISIESCVTSHVTHSRLTLLKTCALVSSLFLLPTRKRLFSRISLSSKRSCDELHQLIPVNPVLKSFDEVRRRIVYLRVRS